jgi:hypothetical protein
MRHRLRIGRNATTRQRVLAHVIPGVEGIYDRFEYLAEKRDALERLAALAERIVNPASTLASIAERRSWDS